MGGFECVSNRISTTDSTEVFTISMSSNTTLNEPKKDLECGTTKTVSGIRYSFWWTLGIDIPLLLIYAILIALFELAVIPSHKSGFYCNDTSLAHEYVGETVTTEVLVSSVLLLPLVIFVLTEYLFMDTEFLHQSKVRRTLKNTFFLYRTYIFGMMLNLGIVEVMKGIMGTPRPTFFAQCAPAEALTCTGSEFVSDFHCTSNQFSSWSQMDSYRSFPSGHSSMSIHCGVFIAWYLQRRAFNWQHRVVLLVPILQLLCISFGAICALTRITDHRHHWWDVLVGVFIGILTALYTVVLTKNFTNYQYTSDVKRKTENECQNTVKTLIYEENRHTVP